jgi:hypothetical protein
VTDSKKKFLENQLFAGNKASYKMKSDGKRAGFFVSPNS